MFGNITLGADPEVFVSKNGDIISAEKMTTGTKNNPFAISDEGHCIQKDNIMLEFNIPPSDTKEEFVDNINTCKTYIETLVSLHDSELTIQSSAVVKDKYLQSDQAKEFGCDPDLNVYAQGANEPICANTNLRTCGGHIHIGIENFDILDIDDIQNIVKAMDMVLGLKSLELDNDDKRRSMYGQAGSFRVKPYGIEYRTLSNFWIKNDELIEWAYDNTLIALNLVSSNAIHQLVENYSEQVELCINSNLKKEAKELLNKINKLILI